MSFRRFPYHFSDVDSFERMNSRSEESRNMFQETSSSSRRNDWQQNESHLEEPMWRAHTPPFRHSTDSVPGSAHGIRGSFPSSWSSPGIPIKVIHETKKGDSDPSRDPTGSSQEGSQTSNTQSPREPRVHHIPIMVEPRDGTSSGYVSDSGSEKSTDATRRNAASDHDMQEKVKRSHSDNKVNGPSQHSENLGTHEATKASKMSEGIRKPHVHHIPITVEPRAGDILPPGKSSSTRKHSPLRHAFPPRATSEDQPFDGPVFSSRKADSASNAEQQRLGTKKNFGRPGNGPHITKIPINVNSDQSLQSSSPPVSPAEVALNQIAKIDNEVTELRKQVDTFSGTNQDKQYRYLDEMLTRCMLKLDDIDTIGMDVIRKSRKLVINKVQECISLLESKLVGSKGTAELANIGASPADSNSGARADNSDTVQTDNITISFEESNYSAKEEKGHTSEDMLNKTAETNASKSAPESLQTETCINQMSNIDKERTNEDEIKMETESESCSKNQNSCEQTPSTYINKESDGFQNDSMEIDNDASGGKGDAVETDKGTSGSTSDSMEIDKEAIMLTADTEETGEDTGGPGEIIETDKETNASKAD